MNIQWPRDVLAPRKVLVEPVYSTMSGGRAIAGLEQIVASDAGYWQIVLDEIPIALSNQKRAWRAVSVNLQGRLNVVDVPIYDYTAPWPNGYRYPVLTPFSDESIFSDGSEFNQNAIAATVTQNASLGAVNVQVTVTTGSALEAGQHFSVQGATKQRLFRIQAFNSSSGGVYNLVVWPPLREAITAGSQAEFDDPRCTCRLLTDREMDTGFDDYAGRTLAKVSFVESLP